MIVEFVSGLAAVLAVLAIAAAVAFARRRARQLEAVVRTLDRPAGTDPLLAAEEAMAAGRAAQAERRRAVEDMLRLAEALGSGAALIDDNLTVTWANGRIHALFARPIGTIRGRSVIGAFADHRIEDLVRLALGPSLGALPGPLPIELTLRDAPHRVLALRAIPTDSSGVWLIADDRTELRRLERIRAEFLDNLSHELRTPLTNIRLLVESLGHALDPDASSGRVRDYVQRIDVESGHMVQMVTEVLDLARIEQGATRLVVSDVDLGALAVSSAERLRAFAERQQVSIRVDAAVGAVHVRGDEDRLGQLLLNLLHNAVKFSHPGGAVVVRCEPQGSDAVISVEDHGVGIPRKDRERIFERFYKVDRARRRSGGGTGLGLTIARHIAEGHGGRIDVESTEGEGSTFRVILPVEGRTVTADSFMVTDAEADTNTAADTAADTDGLQLGGGDEPSAAAPEAFAVGSEGREGD
jgi:two-component system phosphate regulon sensor histidine kinase PhoR